MRHAAWTIAHQAACDGNRMRAGSGQGDNPSTHCHGKASSSLGLCNATVTKAAILGCEYSRGTVVSDTIEDKSASHGATLEDRRRPGRADYQNPHLIPLMRGDPVADAITAPAAATLTLPREDTRDGELGRGILNAMLIGAAIWAATIIAFYVYL
jgi:hypothetical protein